MADWIPELADDDLDFLMDALEAWEAKDIATGMMVDMVAGMMIDRRDPAARADFEREVQTRRAEGISAKRLRKERSVLLRAKLLTIRDRRRAEHMVEGALGR